MSFLLQISNLRGSIISTKLYEYKFETRILGRCSADSIILQGVRSGPLLRPIQQMPFNRAEASLQILLNMKSV